MALQEILFSAEQGHHEQACQHDLIAPALKRAFPLPEDCSDERFRKLLEALSRRTRTGGDQHA